MSEDAEIFLFTVILLTHLAFMIYWAYHFINEIRDTIRIKAPRFYKAVFLCCNERRF